MPINLELNCSCPNCGESFLLADALAQEAIENLQATLSAASSEAVQQQIEAAENAARAEGAAAASEAARSAVQQNVVQQQQQITELQAQLLQVQTSAAAAQATFEQQTQNAITQAQQQWQANANLQLQERDNHIQQLTPNLANLNAQAQQGHSQAQGEVGEVALENILRQLFPMDGVEPVLAGHHGADIILNIKDAGMNAGKIIIEVKNTQNWSNNWIPTLLQNQADANADLAVLVSTKLPANMSEGGLRDNVWVCRFAEFKYLMQALRQSVVAVSQARSLAETRDSDASRLYDFVLSTQFQHAMNALVTPVQKMREHHETEKRALQRVWKKREAEIENALENAANIIGSLAAHVPQGQLPPLSTFPALEDLENDILPTSED